MVSGCEYSMPLSKLLMLSYHVPVECGQLSTCGWSMSLYKLILSTLFPRMWSAAYRWLEDVLLILSTLFPRMWSAVYRWLEYVLLILSTLFPRMWSAVYQWLEYVFISIDLVHLVPQNVVSCVPVVGVCLYIN